jgi:hypothetical protein
MRPELKSACLKAAAKLGIGLSLLVALIGIRLVTTTPEGVESDIKELERLDSQFASEAMAAKSNSPQAESAVDDSVGSILGGGMRDPTPNSGSRSGDGDTLVTCRVGGRTHFMRANDCATRGGQSTIVTRDD